MSEFQLGLLGIGAFVVLGVLGFNKWQESRYRRQSEISLRSNSVDTLLEPSLRQNEKSEIGGANKVDPDASADRDASPGDVASSQVLGTNQAAPASNDLSQALDLVVSVEAPSGITSSGLQLPGGEDGIASRIRIEALRDGVWEALRGDASYHYLNIALQLASRQGAVSRQNLGQFSAWIEEVSVRCGAIYTPVDIESAHGRAVALDKFCSGVDLLIAVHIAANANPFPGTRIRAIAEAAGLTIEADGVFRKRDEEGRELFRLANEGGAVFQAERMRELTTNALIMEFDVARAHGGIHAFNKFRQFAEHLAAGIGGRVVDDNRVPLGGGGFDAIAKELTSVYLAMSEGGIAPGSPESLRLFS